MNITEKIPIDTKQNRGEPEKRRKSNNKISLK